MVLRNSGNSPIEIFERLTGKSVDSRDGEAWHETDTQPRSETSLAIRLLQARIVALDPAPDEDVLELSREEAA
jgi:hypothetical protein